MLSGSRLRGSRTKRVEKYVNEETDSMLVDADSITVFVENTPNVLNQGDRKTLTQGNSSPNVEECNRKWKIDISADALKERKKEQDYFTANAIVRSSRKAKEPSFLIEDGEPCFNPETTAALSSPLSNCENDLFNTNFNKINRANNTRKVRNRLGENLSRIASEGWELCNENDHNESNFQFSDSTKKRAKNYSDRHISNAPKDDSISSEGDLVFSDIFKDKIKNTSCPGGIENGQQSRAKRQQNARRFRSQSEQNDKIHSEHDLFTDFSFSDDESSGKSTLREFQWGKSTPGVLYPDNSTLRDTLTGGNRIRSLSSGKSTVGDLYSEKDTLENRISDEKPPKEDPSKLMEDSEDLVNELNNSGGNEFSDSQGERSFVCLVDQLTDLRVRQKFVAHYANRRRQAVCEELEKALVWNDRCLYEHRRDLNIRKALSNMFL